MGGHNNIITNPFSIVGPIYFCHDAETKQKKSQFSLYSIQTQSFGSVLPDLHRPNPSTDSTLVSMAYSGHDRRGCNNCPIY